MKVQSSSKQSSPFSRTLPTLLLFANLLLAIFFLASLLGPGSVGPAFAKAPVKPKKQASAPAHVVWYGDFQQAMQAARGQNKWLFVVIETSWCHVCKDLDAQILPDPKVQAVLARSFVSVRLDGDRPYAATLMKQYGLPGFPSLLVFRPNGQLQGKICGGASDPDSFLQMLSAMVAGQAR